MCTLRICRRFSVLLNRYPIIDRAADWKKGGDLKNVYNWANFTGLRPLSSRKSDMTPFKTFSSEPTFQTQTQTLSFSTSRSLATDKLSNSDLKKAIDRLTDQFMETRELLEDARESIGTVYFSDDMEEASESVKMTLKEYQDLLSKLSTEQKQEVLRTIGLKMEELKAQQQAIEEHS